MTIYFHFHYYQLYGKGNHLLFHVCMYNNILLEDFKKLEVIFKLLIAKLEGYFPNFQTSL